MLTFEAAYISIISFLIAILLISFFIYYFSIIPTEIGEEIDHINTVFTENSLDTHSIQITEDKIIFPKSQQKISKKEIFKILKSFQIQILHNFKSIFCKSFQYFIVFGMIAIALFFIIFDNAIYAAIAFFVGSFFSLILQNLLPIFANVFLLKTLFLARTEISEYLHQFFLFAFSMVGFQFASALLPLFFLWFITKKVFIEKDLLSEYKALSQLIFSGYTLGFAFCSGYVKAAKINLSSGILISKEAFIDEKYTQMASILEQFCCVESISAILFTLTATLFYTSEIPSIPVFFPLLFIVICLAIPFFSGFLGYFFEIFSAEKNYSLVNNARYFAKLKTTQFLISELLVICFCSFLPFVCFNETTQLSASTKDSVIGNKITQTIFHENNKKSSASVVVTQKQIAFCLLVGTFSRIFLLFFANIISNPQHQTVQTMKNLKEIFLENSEAQCKIYWIFPSFIIAAGLLLAFYFANFFGLIIFVIGLIANIPLYQIFSLQISVVIAANQRQFDLKEAFQLKKNSEKKKIDYITSVFARIPLPQFLRLQTYPKIISSASIIIISLATILKCLEKQKIETTFFICTFAGIANSALLQGFLQFSFEKQAEKSIFFSNLSQIENIDKDEVFQKLKNQAFKFIFLPFAINLIVASIFCLFIQAISGFFLGNLIFFVSKTNNFIFQKNCLENLYWLTKEKNIEENEIEGIISNQYSKFLNATNTALFFITIGSLYLLAQ